MLEDPVRRRRIAAVAAVLGALMLGVTLALIVLNSRTTTTVYVPQPTAPSPASTVAGAPPATQAPAPHATVGGDPPATAPQPSTVRLRMADFTTACQEQHGDTATAKIARNTSEPPSYWVKCFVQGANVGGISLDDYCRRIEPGTRSDNPKRFDYKVADHPWLSWECIPA
jgi:hypothetical protein